MPEAIPFAESNLNLTAPASDPTVFELPVHRTEGGVLWSCWRLTKPELEKILESGVIWLGVWSGKTQPPVSIEVVKPPMSFPCKTCDGRVIPYSNGHGWIAYRCPKCQPSIACADCGAAMVITDELYMGYRKLRCAQCGGAKERAPA